MIAVGKKRIRWIVVEHIVSLEIIRGNTRVYAVGDSDGDEINIDKLDVVDNYAVVIRDTTNTPHYINFNNMDDAIDALVDIFITVELNRREIKSMSKDEVDDIRKEVLNTYGE